MTTHDFVELAGGIFLLMVFSLGTLKTRSILMAAFDDLKASVEKYIADVNAFRQTVAQAIEDAIAADDAGEAVDLNALKAEVDAADAELAAAPITTPQE